VRAFIPAELHEAHARSTRRYIEEGTSNVIGRGASVFPAVRRDGSRFDLEFTVAPMRHGEQHRLVAVLRDVSARTELERMKGEFVATVSHELRTPLTSLLGSLEILRETASLGPEEREFLEMAVRNGERLAGLVNDVLDSEGIESGSVHFDDRRLELRPLLEEAIAMNRAYATAHRSQLMLEEPLPQLAVRGDRARAMQVMANLLSNAAKYSPEGGEVRVRARGAGERVRIEVADRGPGIPDEFKPRIFTRFAQADGSDARVKGGTGLGLAITKSIVERMGGRIGFESAPGHGTTFWFELPVAN
jgi:signal transduction histidine kinase